MAFGARLVPCGDERRRMISDNDFDRLIALGRHKGSIDVDDIKEMMPVETMTTEDLAGLVILLEEHGIAIDLDPELLIPGNWPPPLAPKPLFIPTEETNAFEPTAPLAEAEEPTAAAIPYPEVQTEPATDRFSMDRFVYAMAIGLVMFLLAWAAWSYLLG
jgi:hypothetical protein